MDPLLYTDAAGRAWRIYDFRSVSGQRRAVPIGDWRSESRAFVPVDRAGDVLVYSFGPVAYRDDLRSKFLEDQLRFAKPLGATTAARMDGSSQEFARGALAADVLRSDEASSG